MFSSIYYEQVALLHLPNQLASVETEEFLPKSICYEQVALLHPPNGLASDETEEFLPKHVPHV